MNNKKIIAIILSVFVVVGILLVLKYNLDLRTSAKNPETITDLPVELSGDIQRDTRPGVKRLSIKTQQGDILMDDPREIVGVSEMGSGIFSLTTLENINPLSFGVIFNESNGSFAVGLEKEPIAQARLEAELYLQRTLSIPKEDLCSLNIFMGVSYRVNQFYSGQNLGLSFCPGSVSLE